MYALVREVLANSDISVCLMLLKPNPELSKLREWAQVVKLADQLRRELIFDRLCLWSEGRFLLSLLHKIKISGVQYCDYKIGCRKR